MKEPITRAALERIQALLAAAQREVDAHDEHLLAAHLLHAQDVLELRLTSTTQADKRS